MSTTKRGQESAEDMRLLVLVSYWMRGFCKKASAEKLWKSIYPVYNAFIAASWFILTKRQKPVFTISSLVVNHNYKLTWHSLYTTGTPPFHCVPFKLINFLCEREVWSANSQGDCSRTGSSSWDSGSQSWRLHFFNTVTKTKISANRKVQHTGNDCFEALWYILCSLSWSWNINTCF